MTHTPLRFPAIEIAGRFPHLLREPNYMTLLSMNEITTFRWSFEEDVENYQQAGYRSIGVWRQKISDWDEEQAIDWLATSELSVSNLSWAGGFTGSDGRTLAESIDDACEALRLAAALRAGCLVLYSGARNNHTYRHAGRLLRTAIDALLPLAEAAEVPLAIEPMNAASAANWTFLTELEPLLELIDQFSSPWLKMVYDTYHFPLDVEQYSLLKSAAPYIGIVHLADRRVPPSIEQERCPLGCGLIPLADTISTLQDAGYTGAFDVKLFGSDIELPHYWTLLEHSQLAFAELSNSAATRSLA